MDRLNRLLLPLRTGDRLALTLLIPVLALLLGASLAGARTLSWSSMRVEARLDSSGALHIVEEQTMVFDGDWNGGERGFRLGGNHRIELHGMTRIDPLSGSEIEMIEGDLDRIDRYDWVDGKTLRWRSRLPSDPLFDQQTIVYRLSYTLGGVLRAVDGDYLLDHDFAFPNRPGPIQIFELELELDTVWSAPPDFPVSVRRSDLAPGQSVVLTYRLGHAGPDRPSGVVHAQPRWLWLGLFAASLACMVGLFVRFLGEEMRLGRFSAPEDCDATDPDWLRKNVFGLLPEEVGALWDRKVGPPEVAALIARLVAEGGLASSVQEKGGWFSSRILTLELKKHIAEFRGYEKRLLSKLFFDGRTTTDTQAIRQHYKSSGFSPVSTISSSLERRVRELPGGGPPRPAPSWKPTAWLAAGLVVLALLEIVLRGPAGGLILVGIAFVAILLSALSWAMASRFSYRLSAFVRGALGFVLPALFVWLICFGGGARADSGVLPSLAGLLVLALLPVVLFNSFLNWAQSRDSKATFDRRYRLFAARIWFEKELERDRPRLRDEWFPYLLAFGLDKDVDDWFEKFGGTAAIAHGSTSSTFSTGGSSSSDWTGGGGAFGGGGATAAWGAAAAGLASGVAAPSSGGSGGGSVGGGGGSSGGGSGGGW